ncbi:MAG: organic hydroperoxide resistance protein, partial [Shewanella sp.]
MKALYETRATARAGRQGRVSTEDGLLDVPLAYPK